jgi:hypothetical protein
MRFRPLGLGIKAATYIVPVIFGIVMDLQATEDRNGILLKGKINALGVVDADCWKGCFNGG